MTYSQHQRRACQSGKQPSAAHPAISQPAQEEEEAAAAIRTRFRSLQRGEADILLRKRLGGQKKEKKEGGEEDNIGSDD